MSAMRREDGLVSAILIFLDGERFIEEAIESVFAQTYPRWELILADDGSSDGSTAIARRWADAHPDRVRYVEHPGHRNLGMSATRNLALRHARGAYVGFIDADDVWLPEKLARQVALLEAHPEVGMIYPPTAYWYGWTGDPADEALDEVAPLGVPPETVVHPPTMLLRFLQEIAKPPPTSGALMRRATVDRVGGYVESFRTMYEDQAFFAKMVLAAPVFATATYSSRYRQHPRSACARADAAGVWQQAEDVYLRWLAHHLAGYRFRFGPEWTALRRLLQPYRRRVTDRLLARARRLVGQRRA